MSFGPAFLLSSYFLVSLGLAGLFLTDELSPLYLVCALVSMLLGALADLRGGKGFLPGVVANLAMLVVFTLTLFAIFILRALPLQELVHFLLALQAVKLLAPKKSRDWLQLYLLSFFSLLASSALSVELSFAAVFLCYLFAAPWVLMLFHLKTATEAAGKNPEIDTRLLSWSLFRLAGAIDVVLLLLTVLFFVSFPRLGAGFFGNAWATGSAVTGFSDRLALGEVAEIQRNNAVAMRVSIDGAGPQPGGEFYWRGVALDLFDGRKWQKSRYDSIPLKRQGETFLVREAATESAEPVRQRITLEPSGSTVLFALSGPVVVSGRFPALFQDGLGNLRAGYPFPFEISYAVMSQPDARWQEAAPGGSALQLPAVDPRLPELTHRIADGVRGNRNKAQALERYLRENYRYSLENLPTGKADPLAVFLFQIRHGNCEYFASALAVMLRILGIPSRVVNGYLGGEWNPYGEYYLVRQSNAHSWVEAYFPDKGWMRLDPTPPVPRRPGDDLLSSFTHFVDFLRTRWYRNVVNFTFADQYEIFNSISRPGTWFALDWARLSWDELTKRRGAYPGWWSGALLALAALAIAWIRLKRRRRRGSTESRGSSYQATQRYQRLLALLKKRRLLKRAGETADEFSRRVEVAVGTRLVREFTALYQQARFSGEIDMSDSLRRMDRILVQLGK